MATINYGKMAGTAGAGGDFEPIPPGWYECEAEAAEFRDTSTGSDMYVVTWVVDEGPHKNRKMWQNLVCKNDSAGSVSFFFGSMRTLGLDQQWFSDNVGKVDDEDEDAVEAAHAAICAELVGKRAGVKTVHDTYKGKTKNEVKALRAPAKRKSDDDGDSLPGGKPKRTAEEKAAKKAKKAKRAADEAKAVHVEEPAAKPPAAKPPKAEKPAKKTAKRGATDMPPGLG